MRGQRLGHRATYLFLIAAAICCGQQPGSQPIRDDWTHFATVPSKYIEMGKKVLASGKNVIFRYDVDRAFTRQELSAVSFEKATVKETGREWGRWFMDVQWLLRDAGILREPFGRSGSRTIERSLEFDLKEYEYREQAESKGVDGDTFVIVRVLTGVSHSADFEDINLVYYAMRRMLIRQLAAQDGPFPDLPVEVGDACYHLDTTNFGFIRGNVIVEIHLTPGRWVAGGLTVESTDTAWHEKMIDAAKRIDAMLLEKMFDAPTRAKIIAAEQARTSTSNTPPQPNTAPTQPPPPSP